MKKTGFVRISDTVRFIHHIHPKPTITTAKKVVDATNNLVSILNKAANDVPQSQLEAIATLCTVLMMPPKQSPQEPITQERNKGTNDDSMEEFKDMEEDDTTVKMSNIKQAPQTIVEEETTEEEPCPPKRQVKHTYNLRSVTQSQNECNSIIINETKRIQNAPLTSKYGISVRHLVKTELKAAHKLHEQALFVSAILDLDTGKQMEYRDLQKHDKYKTICTKSFTKELAQLAQGLKDIGGTDTIFFIHHKDVPRHKTVTYGRIVVDYRP